MIKYYMFKCPNCGNDNFRKLFELVNDKRVVTYTICTKCSHDCTEEGMCMENVENSQFNGYFEHGSSDVT